MSNVFVYPSSVPPIFHFFPIHGWGRAQKFLLYLPPGQGEPVPLEILESRAPSKSEKGLDIFTRGETTKGRGEGETFPTRSITNEVVGSGCVLRGPRRFADQLCTTMTGVNERVYSVWGQVGGQRNYDKTGGMEADGLHSPCRSSRCLPPSSSSRN